MSTRKRTGHSAKRGAHIQADSPRSAFALPARESWFMDKGWIKEHIKEEIEEDPKVLDRIGIFGDTVLHWCVLNEGVEREMTPLTTERKTLEPRASEMARWLIDTYPDLVPRQYACIPNEDPSMDRLYVGENALHIAAIRGLKDTVRLLLDAGGQKYRRAQLLARACGSFFDPKDAKERDNLMKDGWSCYYGEYPLSFAVAVGHGEIVQMLLRAANQEEGLLQEVLTARDSYGNTAFHIAAAPLDGKSQPDILTLLLKYFRRVIWDGDNPVPMILQSPQAKKRAIIDYRGYDTDSGVGDRDPFLLQNAYGHTPLTAAALHGEGAAFRVLIKQSARVIWTFGPMCEREYRMEQFDTDRVFDRSAESGEHIVCIMALVLSQQRPDKSVLADPVFSLIIARKWKNFGRVTYFISLFTHFVHVGLATALASDYRDGDLVNPALEITAVTVTVLRLLLFISDLYFNISEGHARKRIHQQCRQKYMVDNRPPDADSTRWRQIQELQNWTIQNLPPSRGSMPNTLYTHLGNVAYISHIVHFSMWAGGELHGAQLPLAITMLLLWVAFFRYTIHPKLRPIGVLIIIIDSALKGDVSKYLVILSVFIFAFATALISLGVYTDQWMLRIVLELFRVAVGEKPPWSKKDTTDWYVFVYILFVLFTLQCFIVLLRILISMFNKTFGEIHGRADHEWLVYYSRWILRHERRMQLLPYCLRRHTIDREAGGQTRRQANGLSILNVVAKNQEFKIRRWEDKSQADKPPKPVDKEPQDQPPDAPPPSGSHNGVPEPLTYKEPPEPPAVLPRAARPAELPTVNPLMDNSHPAPEEYHPPQQQRRSAGVAAQRHQPPPQQEERRYSEQVAHSGSPPRAAAPAAGGHKVGERVQAMYLDGDMYAATVYSRETDGTYTVRWFDGTFSECLPAEHMYPYPSGAGAVEPTLGSESGPAQV